MNRGWAEVKMDPKDVRVAQKKMVPQNAWSNQKSNSAMKILKRDSNSTETLTKVHPNLEDKTKWPSLGGSGKHCLHFFTRKNNFQF